MMERLKLIPDLKQKRNLVTLGKIKGAIWKQENLTEDELNHHVHVVGASGFGKTVLLSHIIRQRIENGKGLLFIDLKGDLETLMKFTKYASDCGRASDLNIFSITEKEFSVPYNILGDGNATQLRDRVIGSLSWTEEYYKNQSSSFLLKLFLILCWLRDNKGEPLNIATVLKCCESIDWLVDSCNRVPCDQLQIKVISQNLLEFLSDKENYRSIQGLRTQLESIALSDFGTLVTPDSGGINLFNSYRNSEIVFLFLDTRRYGETARSLGKFILQDLKFTSAKIDAEIRNKDRNPFSVIIDEFADLASEDFIGFLDRARSSKMSVVVSHQEICDLNRISPDFAGRLMGNTSTLYAFLQKRPESAELISSIAGTRKAWSQTEQSNGFLGFDIRTGAKSFREVEEFRIHPNTVKSLEVGNCVCIKKYPKAKSYQIKINNAV